MSHKGNQTLGHGNRPGDMTVSIRSTCLIRGLLTSPGTDICPLFVETNVVEFEPAQFSGAPRDLEAQQQEV
jgi:hypothetical protein